MVDILGSLILASLSGVLLVRPFFSRRTGESYDGCVSGRLLELNGRRDNLITGLRELDLDYDTGKVGEDEYVELRAEARKELGEVLIRLDSESAK